MGYSTCKFRELLEMDPYEEVAQQGQAPPLSPAYVPDPMELDEHVPIYVPDPKHPKYHVPTDDDIQVEEQPYADDASPTAESPGHIADSESMEEDSIDYPNEPEDDDEDPEEDPEEDHTNDPVDGEDGDDEPFNDDTDDEDEEPTEVKEEEEHIASAAPLGHRATIIRMRDDIPEEDMPPRRRFVLSAPPPGCDVAESSSAAAARPPRGQYDFVDTVETGQGLIRSPGHDAWTIARAADRAEDAGYVRKQESEDFYTQLHDARTDRKDIRLEINVVRGQRIAYETELHECQRAEDDAVRQMMRTHVLEARAQIDTVEDTGSSC
ncbi:hypothetical protein Tco_1207581 [Tanacetum coccineum]